MLSDQVVHKLSLLVSAEKMSHIWLENSPVCTKIIDFDFKLQYMSNAGVLGLNIADINAYYGKPFPLDFYPQSFREQMFKKFEQSRDTGITTSLEAPLTSLKGDELWFDSTVVPIFNEQNILEYFIVVSINITDRKHAEMKLQQMNLKLESLVISRTQELEEANRHLVISSETDYLTQLPNRRYYERRYSENIATAKRNCTPLSLLMIDIDDFKEYNDHYGHDLGDLILRRIADSISNSLKRDTDFISRFGGEEFVVLLPDTDTTNALAIAEQIRANINKLALQHSESLTEIVNISIGIESLKGSKLNQQQLLKHADIALYQAKESGKNCCRVYSKELS